jgi:hypothetical protein
VRRTVLLVAALVAASAVASCAGDPNGKTLSFAQMQAMNPGVSGEWMLGEFPFASHVGRWPNGKIRELRYPVTDPAGKLRSVTYEFDQSGVLVQKRYAGAYILPPPETDAVK